MDRSGELRQQANDESNLYEDGAADYSSVQQREYRNDSGRARNRRGYDVPPALSQRDSRIYGDHETSTRRERSYSPRPNHRESRYVDRDREGYTSPSGDDRRPSSQQQPESRTVILEGLPSEVNMEDIKHELQTSFNVQGLQEVRLIYDKRTGKSRRFAFAQFETVDNARDFLEPNFPSITFSARRGDSANEEPLTQVRISYSREKDDRPRPGDSEFDWKCDVCTFVNFGHRGICFRCNAPRTVGTMAQTGSVISAHATTGESDVSPDNTPSQFLIFRGLEPGVTERLLANGVAKLYKSKDGALDVATTKKGKIASTGNDKDLGAREGSLQRILLVRDKKSGDSWRYGFAEFASVEDAQAAMKKFISLDKYTISSKPVTVSYVHAGIFVPVIMAPTPESDRFTFSPLHNPAIKLKYWDDAGYVSLLVLANESATTDSSHNRPTGKQSSDAGGGGFAKDDSKNKKRKAEKEALPVLKKAVAPHLQFWSNRHAELHGIQRENEEGDGAAKEQPFPLGEDNSKTTRSFADLTRNCCLLCARQFKTQAEVHKHERLSQLHQDNMKNEALVRKALGKLEKAAIRDATEDTDSAAYRDRAKERRQAYSQPKQPAAQHGSAVTEKALATSPTEKPETSKGAALLGKMGWTSGTGLGAQGTGRTEIISTELYAQGVGLGAEGGKVGDAAEEANRSTQGSYAAFVQKSKDKAKERYERM